MMSDMGKRNQGSGRGAPPAPSDAQAWVEAWKTAGAELERLRRRKLRALTPRRIHQAMLGFNEAFKAVRRRKAGRRGSGLVEMQAWFRRMRK
jgi:hypothetical protein